MFFNKFIFLVLFLNILMRLVIYKILFFFLELNEFLKFSIEICRSLIIMMDVFFLIFVIKGII